MSDYVIKSYDESYLEKQVEIGTYFSKKWIAYTQTPLERLKQAYSRDSFDPDTRLYCFKDDEMIGFIGANITEVEEENIKRADTRLAFVLPGHEEAFFSLYKKLEEILKEKGVSVIQTIQSTLNDNYYELTEKLGFTFDKSSIEIYMGATDSYTKFETDLPISDFNQETDLDQAKKKLKEVYENLTDEIIDNYLNNTITRPESFAFRVTRDGEKIVAFCAVRESSTKGLAQIGLLLGENSEYKKHIISDAMSICKDNGFEKVTVLLSTEAEEDVKETKDFMAVGFEKATTIDMLVKKL